MRSKRSRPTSRGQALPLLVAALTSVSALGIFLARVSGRNPATTSLAGTAVWVLPASAHAPGMNGANWRTDLEVHNAGATAATYTVELLVRDAENLTPQGRTFSLSPQQSVRYVDALMGIFGFTGAAALRITASSDLVMVTSRTYNQIGPNPWSLPEGSSFGQFVPALTDADAIATGEEGRLIQIAQSDAASLADFRTNLGLVNLTADALDVTVEFYRADGTYLGMKSGSETRLRGFEFRQLNEAMKAWGTISDGYAVVKPASPGGRMYAFATVIDNHNSGDAVFMPAAKKAAGGAAPTPTPTVPARLGNLFPYQPPDWQSAIVADSQMGRRTTTLLSSLLTTYVSWAVANGGPGDISGTIEFELRLDGARLAGWYVEDGLPAGYYLAAEDHDIPAGQIAAGTHTLAIVADYTNRVVETNESDNTASGTWTWTTAFSVSPGEVSDEPAGVRGTSAGSSRKVRRPIAGRHASYAGSAVRVLPASAHAPGMNGANWRTDLEVHNAGTAAATYTVELLARDAENLAPPNRTFSIPPQQSVRYADALMGIFGFTGAAALRITASSDLVMVTSRTYNQIGPNPWNLPQGSSFGQFVPALTDARAIATGEEGRLIQLSHQPASTLTEFRTNVGLVNATGAPLDVTVDFYRADGTYLGTKSGSETRLRGYEFRQLNEAMGAWGTIADGYAVIKPATAGGKMYAFATVIDNHNSGDAFFMPAAKKAAGVSAPTPTPTPTRTPTPPVGGTPTPTPTPTRTPTPPSGSTPTPTPTPTPPVSGDVIHGPSGSTLTLAPGYKETGMTVSLSAASITPLVRGNETPVSSAVKVSVSGNEPLLAGGNFKITIPVTSSVSDPSILMMKALLTTGIPYPVLGIYDAAARTYTAEVTGLWDGWVFGVVSEPGVGFLSSSAGHGREPLGWRTPMDWGTCVFHVVKHTNVWSDAKIENDIIDPAWAACDDLRNEGFRSPRLWIDSRTNSRIIHLSNDPTLPTMYAECFAESPLPWCDPSSSAFSTRGLTEDQLLLLGAIYYNVSEMAPFLVSPFFATPGGALAHEMTHASMLGTDVRTRYYAKADGGWTDALNAWSEAGATILEGTYSARGNRLGEGTVTVRVDPNPEQLDAAVDDPEQGIYTKQDFLGWFAKKYTNGSMTFIRSMYEAMSDETNGQYGLPAGQYRALYRRAVDRIFRAISGKGLPDVYHEFALDRGYRRTAALSLRTGDALPNRAHLALFPDRQDWNPAIQPTLDVRSLPPLTTRLIRFPLPAAVLARPTFDFSVASSVDVSATGVRVTIFREDAAGVMLPGGEIAVTDAKQPVKVPMTAPVANISILVSNTSVEDRTATVKLGTFGSAIFAGKWAPEDKQGNDCYSPAKLFAPPLFAAVFVLDKGTLIADQEFLGLLDPKYGYTLTGSGAITGGTATLAFSEGWIDFDDSGVAKARLDVDVTWSGARKPVPPEAAAKGVTEYFEGPSNIVFRTSAPHAPCTTSFTSPKNALVGPCDKPHCQD